MEKYGFDTIQVHGGYTPDSDTKSNTPAIYQTTAYAYDSTQHAADLFELKAAGNIYSRIQNPTNDFFEKRMALLEGGVGALSFASGHAAIFAIITNLAVAGDNIVTAKTIYGGAVNMIGVTLGRLGIDSTFVDDDDMDQWEAAVNDKTRAFFVEGLGNPSANVADIKSIAEIAHKHGIPLIVDGTFTTPYLQRPIEFGADIVVHSATKYIGGHGNSMGGVVIDSGKFKYLGNPRFPLFNEPDKSYHGVIFAKDFGEAAFITRLRVMMMRDLGACLSPFNSFMFLNGLETLSLRMAKHCSNAMELAKYFEANKKIKSCSYCGLETNPKHKLASEMLSGGYGAMFTVEIDGTREQVGKFIDALELVRNVSNLGDARTLVGHPATTTHSQLSEQQLVEAGISVGTVRVSVGIEDVRDLIADFDQAINKVL